MSIVVQGLLGPLLVTIGFASGTNPVGAEPAAICLSDSAFGTVTVGDSALEC